MKTTTAAQTILSGMRPTGKLHLGHMTGALENWTALQQEGYRTFYFVADYHALTTNLNTDNIYNDSIEMVIDWLAAGIDPSISPIFRQSQVKQHAELHLIFSMLITKNRLERNPSIKDQIRDLNIENVTYGHLGYPVLQAADILMYRANLVPVGEDQLSHVEISREIARSFNNQYGEVFPVPQPKLTKFGRLPGLDGINVKMSKSLGNTILLSDDDETVRGKLRKAVTDPLKLRKNDPGRPDICLVYTYHTKFNPTETGQIHSGCESGALGCVECKLRCSAKINEYLEPHRERRVPYENDRQRVADILAAGEDTARVKAEETMQTVRSAMNMG